MSTEKQKKKKIYFCALCKVDEVKLIILFISEMITAQTFSFSSSKNCRKYFFWILFFDNFFCRKITFSASRPGVANPRPKKKFLRRNSVVFRCFEFCSVFLNAAHRPIRVGHPCSRQTSRDFFVVFLVRGFDRRMKKKPKSKFGRITFWTFGHPISHCGFWMFCEVKDPRLVFSWSLWNLDCDGNQRWVF